MGVEVDVEEDVGEGVYVRVGTSVDVDVDVKGCGVEVGVREIGVKDGVVISCVWAFVGVLHAVRVNSTMKETFIKINRSPWCSNGDPTIVSIMPPSFLYLRRLCRVFNKNIPLYWKTHPCGYFTIVIHCFM